MKVAKYACGLCGAKAEGPADKARALLQLCPECFEKRRAKGLEAQRRADAQAAGGVR